MRRLVFLMFDVDVAGLFVGRLDEDFVDQLDDRRFLGLLGDLAVVGLEFFEKFDLGRLPLLDHGRDGFAADAEMGLDEPGDLARTGQHRPDAQAGQRLQFVQGVHVEGIAGGHDQGAVLPVDGQQAAAMDQLGRQGTQRFRGDGHLGQIDQVEAEIIGQDGQQSSPPWTSRVPAARCAAAWTAPQPGRCEPPADRVRSARPCRPEWRENPCAINLEMMRCNYELVAANTNYMFSVAA